MECVWCVYDQLKSLSETAIITVYWEQGTKFSFLLKDLSVLILKCELLVYIIKTIIN